MSTVSKMLYFFDSRVFRSQNLRFLPLEAGGCRWDRQMSTGQDTDDGNAIMQKRGFCLDRRVYSIQPRDFRALCNQRQHGVERDVSLVARGAHRVAEISAQTTRWL